MEREVRSRCKERAYLMLSGAPRCWALLGFLLFLWLVIQPSLHIFTTKDYFAYIT